MVATRVGYAGGTTENPTYHNLGDHTETIQIDYDPTQISYRLRGSPTFMDEFAAIYPDPADLVNSTAAVRVNGYLGGYGTLADLQAEIDDLGLSPEAREELLEIVLNRR